MSNSLHFSHDKFPFSDLPNTAEAYYEHVRRDNWSTKREVLNSRETLIAALESDEDFAAFWKSYRETHPDSEDYLSSLTDATQPFDNSEITARYTEFLRCQKLSDISTSAREKIQSEFNAIRSTLYQSFLEKEAVRLNCLVSEVRPKVPVLPLQEDGAESELCSLPDDVFAKIMARLETIEIFQLTQVCKKWRQIIYLNAAMVTRAEHSLTTHLLTFTEWMDPSNIVKGRNFRDRYQSFGWSLMKWCSNMSQNLETFVLSEFDYPYINIVQLSRQCPNLKHLHFKFTGPVEEIGPDLYLPKLESLITENSHFKCTSKFVVHMFTTSTNLRIFKGKLNTRDVISINEKRLNGNAFSSLIALQIMVLSNGLFGALASLDRLQLRYLHLGDSFSLTRYERHPQQRIIDEERDAFHCFLSKQNQLEVLVLLYDLDLDETTIKVMTRRQQNLKSAMIWFHVTSLNHEEVVESIDGRGRSDDHVVLGSFERMLLEKDPSTNLSAFEFIVEDARSKSFLEDAKTGFSIHLKNDLHFDLFDKWNLSHPAMRRRLGIDF